MFDFFEAARVNDPALANGFRDRLTSLRRHESSLLTEFSDWVKFNTLISINTKLYVVIELLNGRPYQNIYEWADEQARLSGRSREEIMREQLGPYYDQRLRFDSEFEEGPKLRYGALNAGGLGTITYDPYCVVLSSVFQQSLSNFACIPGDSLKICFLANGLFDKSDLATRIASAQWHLLVTQERATEIAVVDKHEWPNLIVSATHYFEVIFIGNITRDAILSIRVSQAEYSSKWHLAFQNLGSKRSEAERAVLNDFVQLRRAELDGRVKVEVLQ